MTEWDLKPGDLRNRTELAKRFGGNRQTGISHSARTPNILIYSDPSSGADFGYIYDGWSPNEPDVFYYTGEGTSGDQEISHGNKAILEHLITKRSLRVFEAASGKQIGGKLHRYLGEFSIDPEDPYRWESAPGEDGQLRKVIVFKLHAHDAGPARELSEAKEIRRPVQHKSPFTVDLVYTKDDVYEYVTESEVTVQRKKEAIFEKLEEWFELRGSELSRWKIPVPGSTSLLLTDVYDDASKTLWQVATDTSRSSIRMAIGQLADYLRFLPKDTKSGVVLPAAVEGDLQNFIFSSGHRLLIAEARGYKEVLRKNS